MAVLLGASVLDSGAPGWRRHLLVPVLVFVGMLISIVSSLGAPLIPTIADDFGISLGLAQWSLTIALLAGAVSSPVVGRLGDGPRRRQVLLLCLGILVLGSALAALPTGEFAVLLVGRAMQGVALALLPLVMGIARDHLDPERGRATLATLSVTAVIGVGLGYPLTGLVAEHLNYEDGFWLAAILGSAAMALCALVVPASKHRASQPLDIFGASYFGVGLSGLLIAISQGSQWGWGSARLAFVGAASVTILAGWSGRELRSASPMVDLRLMRVRSVLTANISVVLAGIGMYMLISMMIRYVQTPTSISYGLGASVVVGGLVLLPFSIASYVSSKTMTYISKRVPPDRLVPIGMLAFIASLVVFAVSRDQLWETFVVMALCGVGMGFSFAIMPRLIAGAATPEQISSALAANQVLRTIGYSIGSALAATILTAHTRVHVAFPDGSGYTVGAVVAMVLCSATAVLCLALRPGVAVAASLAAEDELQVTESVDSAIAGVLAYDLPADVDARTPAGNQVVAD